MHLLFLICNDHVPPHAGPAGGSTSASGALNPFHASAPTPTLSPFLAPPSAAATASTDAHSHLPTPAPTPPSLAGVRLKFARLILRMDTSRGRAIIATDKAKAVPPLCLPPQSALQPTFPEAGEPGW